MREGAVMAKKVENAYVCAIYPADRNRRGIKKEMLDALEKEHLLPIDEKEIIFNIYQQGGIEWYACITVPYVISLDNEAGIEWANEALTRATDALNAEIATYGLMIA